MNGVSYIKLRNKIMNRGDQFKTYKYTNKRMNKYCRHIIGLGMVCSVCVTPDGKYVVSGSENGTVRITRFDNGKLVREIRGHQCKVNMVCVTPDGRYVLSWSRSHYSNQGW